MNHSKNLFFSEDEIEAVDMEIETLLLARKRQEDATQFDNGPSFPQPPSKTPAASRPLLEAVQPVSYSPIVRNSPSALPPQRLQKADNHKLPTRFRIEPDQDSSFRWPTQEARNHRGRKVSVKRRDKLRPKWLIVLALSIMLWLGLIAGGYAVWHSGNLLNLARFIFDLL